MTAERQAFAARTGALPEVTVYVERRCQELRLPRPVTLKLLLVAEELFINSVLHGYGGDSAQEVSFSIGDSGAEVELIAENQAPPFDPFEQLPTVAPGRDPDARPVGGLGRVLIAGLSLRQHYERTGPVNRMTVYIAKSQPPS